MWGIKKTRKFFLVFFVFSHQFHLISKFLLFYFYLQTLVFFLLLYLHFLFLVLKNNQLLLI